MVVSAPRSQPTDLEILGIVLPQSCLQVISRIGADYHQRVIFPRNGVEQYQLRGVWCPFVGYPDFSRNCDEWLVRNGAIGFAIGALPGYLGDFGRCVGPGRLCLFVDIFTVDDNKGKLKSQGPLTQALSHGRSVSLRS